MNYGKLWRGTLISCVVGGLTYVMGLLGDGDLRVGEFTPLAVAGIGILVNALKLALFRQAPRS